MGWLDPKSPAEVNAMVNAFVSSQLDPLLAQLFRTERRGARSIRVGGRALRRRLRPLAGQTRADYGRAAAQEARISDAIAAANRGGGQAASLEAALSGIDPATAAHYAGQVRTAGRGRGAAAATFGGNALEQLLSGGAAETAYARKLPGIAGFATQQGIGALHEAAMGARGEIMARAPGLAAEERARLRSEQIGLAQSNRAFAEEEAAERGKPTFTPKERAEGMEDAIAAGAELAEDLKGQTTESVNPVTGKKTERSAAPDYADVARRVRALIAGQLRSMGYSAGEINQAVSRALAVAGYSRRDYNPIGHERTHSTFGPGGLFPVQGSTVYPGSSLDYRQTYGNLRGT